MQGIRAFSLHNGGGFVCRIKLDGIKKPELTGNIALGQTKQGNIGGADVNPGQEVRLEARVISGRNNVASQSFTYDPNSNLVAYYTITGTTLKNTMGLIEVK